MSTYSGSLRDGRVRVAIDTEHLDQLAPFEDIFTYSDLFPTVEDYLKLSDRFPNSRIYLGERGLGDPTGLAVWCDSERFAMTPEQVPAWHQGKHDAGYRGMLVYASLDNWPPIDAAMDGRNFYHWVAAWGHARIPERPWAMVQALSAGGTSLPWDISFIWDTAWQISGPRPTSSNYQNLRNGLYVEQPS